jgi:hypothetical protein
MTTPQFGPPPINSAPLLNNPPVLLPPKIEELAVAFLQPFLDPTPVATRLPSPDNNADTVNGFLRVEAGGGTMPDMFQYDMTCLLHGYSPDESQANDITNLAIGLMGAADGTTVNGFYITYIPSVGVAQRRTDPDVNLPRYLASVTWRIPGQPITL